MSVIEPVGPTGRDPAGVLADLRTAAGQARRYDIGYPGATDLAFPELAEWLTGQLLNNIGDPWDLGHGRNHTKTTRAAGPRRGRRPAARSRQSLGIRHLRLQRRH